MHICCSTIHIYLFQACSPRSCTSALPFSWHFLKLSFTSNIFRGCPTGYKYLLRATICQLSQTDTNCICFFRPQTTKARNWWYFCGLSLMPAALFDTSDNNWIHITDALLGLWNLGSKRAVTPTWSLSWILYTELRAGQLCCSCDLGLSSVTSPPGSLGWLNMLGPRRESALSIQEALLPFSSRSTWNGAYSPTQSRHLLLNA